MKKSLIDKIIFKHQLACFKELKENGIIGQVITRFEESVKTKDNIHQSSQLDTQNP